MANKITARKKFYRSICEVRMQTGLDCCQCVLYHSVECLKSHGKSSRPHSLGNDYRIKGTPYGKDVSGYHLNLPSMKFVD